MIELNDKQFKMRFRLPKNVVEELEGRLHAQLQTKTNKNHALNPIFMILLTLRFYASGSFQMVVGDIFNNNKATACRTIHKVSAQIAGLRPQLIKMPTEEVEVQRVKKGL